MTGYRKKQQQIAKKLAILEPYELRQLKNAVAAEYGGAQIQEPLFSKMLRLELVYRNTRRLRPDVCDFLEKAQPES